MYKLPHHQLIYSCLKNFNSNFLKSNHILFGGGTRISLEIDEYRESIDIDFLCQNKKSYRAVREQTTNISLGDLVKKDFDYKSDIKFDRDAVRTFISVNNTTIKLEFVCFDNYQLTASDNIELFPVPFIDHISCFYTKLLANADRAGVKPFKDIFDLLTMCWKWNGIPQKSFELAREHYSFDVDKKLKFAIKHLFTNQAIYEEHALAMNISKDFFHELLVPTATKLLQELK